MGVDRRKRETREIGVLGTYNRRMSANAESRQSNTIELPEIITDEFLEMLRASGVKKASLFGSFARGEEGTESDVDLLVEFDHEVSILARVRLNLQLSELSGQEVRVMTKIHPYFEPYILPTLVPLPL